jgi:two-component system LytT family response regulator
MKVLIIEDEAPAARRLKKLLEEIDVNIEVLDVIDSVEASIKWLQIHTPPEVIFLDIQLADGESFEIFKKVKVLSPIIFTTAYDEFAIKAFKVNSIDYLLKPIEPDELKKGLEKLKELKLQLHSHESAALNSLLSQITKPRQEYKERFLIKLGERLISVDVSDVAYFKTEGKYSYMVIRNDKKFLTDHPLDELEKLLDPKNFFRLNRQFIAHYTAIQNIHNYFNGKLKLQLLPSVKDEVIVSREKASAFKDWLNK